MTRNSQWKDLLEGNNATIEDSERISKAMFDNTERVMRLIDTYVEGKSVKPKDTA
jgi:hypothetical protein